MIIGFLGKGGSGKTTLSTIMTKYLLEKSKNVLAIDADHNMDYSFNLGVTENIPYFGQSMSHIKQSIGLQPAENFRLAFLQSGESKFSIFPDDEYTKEYVVNNMDNLKVMVAGPHTEEIMEGDKCSHTLFIALKIFLPFLRLDENQFVIIDEKAGMDPVGTTVPAGFDIAIISSEPTVHSTKTANQISAGLQKYGTPYIFVGNKVQNEEQKTFLKNNLWAEPVAYFDFDFSKTTPFTTPLTESEISNLEKILSVGSQIKENSANRISRTTNFWQKNK